MPKKENQTPKMLAVLKLLQEETDREHWLSAPEIVERLLAQGIPCQRKSIYSDILTLQQQGYNIEMVPGRSGGYYIEDRDFELSEVKLLVDAVQSSRFISPRRSRQLIHKLEKLTSRYYARTLQRQVCVANRTKTMNNNVLYNTDLLHEAINENLAVSFRYRNSDLRTVSPWHLAWENGNYYLIAYQDYRAPYGPSHYRVDRITDIWLEDEPRRGQEVFADFDLPAYIREHFEMFGGERCSVTLRCAKSLREAMQDRFGKENIMLLDEEDGWFHFDVTVRLSDRFYGWVLGFGGQVTVLGPASVRDKLRAMGEQLVQTYGA